MRIRAKHVGADVFELTSGKHGAVTDLSPEYGGTGLGPMPSEYLLWSIAACFGQSIRFVAAKMRKNVEELTLEVQAGKNLKEQRIGAVTIVVGCTGSAAQLEKIVETAKRYCFVTNSLSIPVHCIVENREHMPAVTLP